MIDIFLWCRQFVDALQKTFGNRIWFVGLQGSYGRGEATEDSDIDMVVVLDALSPADIDSYNRVLDNLPYREKRTALLEPVRSFPVVLRYHAHYRQLVRIGIPTGCRWGNLDGTVQYQSRLCPQYAL